MANSISLEECVVAAMDGTDKELFPFLPYILQDTWKIGADPETIIALIQKHMHDFPNMNVLDLGCGKGAVSVLLSSKLKCSCYGIDAVPEFIDEANKKAKEYSVNNLCKFEVADIRIKMSTLPRYDVIILGAVGPVLGNYFSTLTSLAKNLHTDGVIIIDDGYIESNSSFTHPLILKQDEIHRQIEAAGMKLIDEAIIEKNEIKSADDQIFSNLKKRCLELMDMHPEKHHLFEAYIKKQEEENDVLENKIICSTMVIKRTNNCHNSERN
ncbi:MAG: methyltransferase domain-containing protein [Ignavibacteriaceae bacterium]|nr:methyltransferase domain-containing protein [Ignavibacteriaceae bacterium]